MLDANEDDRVTETELSEGLFTNWDADQNDVLDEKEFDVGAQNSGVFQELPGGFPSLDENGDDRLTKAEFEVGIAERAETEQWADAQCDELGL